MIIMIATKIIITSQVNCLLRLSVNKSVSYFSLKKISFMGEEIVHKNDTRNTL